MGLVHHYATRHRDRESDLREFGININAIIIHDQHTALV